MIRTEGRYWCLEDCGESYPGERRWLVFARSMSQELKERLAMSRVITDWPVDVKLECDPPHVFEDMPWLGEPFHLVSARLRSFFEHMFPNTAQFLPVDMVDSVTRRTVDAPPYYLVNWLHTAHCIDYNRSIYEPYTSIHGRMFFRAMVIDQHRVNCTIARVKDYEVAIIAHDDVRRAIRAHGFSGVKFYSRWNSMDDIPKPVPPFPLDFKCPC